MVGLEPPSAAAVPPAEGLLLPSDGGGGLEVEEEEDGAAYRDALRTTLLTSPRAGGTLQSHGAEGAPALAATAHDPSVFENQSLAATSRGAVDLFGARAPEAAAAVEAAASSGFPVGGLPSPASILDVGAPLPAAAPAAPYFAHAISAPVGGLRSPAGPEGLLPSDTIRESGGEAPPPAAGGGKASKPGAVPKEFGVGDLKTKLGKSRYRGPF